MKESRTHEVQANIYLVDDTRKISKARWFHWKYYDTEQGAKQALKHLRERSPYMGSYNAVPHRGSPAGRYLWRYRVVKIESI